MAYIINVNDIESTKNKTQSLSAESTNKQYPSAKAVYDAIQNSGSNNTENTTNGFKIEQVDSLPTIDTADDNTIYVTASYYNEGNDDAYNEYVKILKNESLGSFTLTHSSTNPAFWGNYHEVDIVPKQWNTNNTQAVEVILMNLDDPNDTCTIIFNAELEGNSSFYNYCGNYLYTQNPLTKLGSLKFYHSSSTTIDILNSRTYYTWERIGYKPSIDLSGYATKELLNSKGNIEKTEVTDTITFIGGGGGVVTGYCRVTDVTKDSSQDNQYTLSFEYIHALDSDIVGDSAGIFSCENTDLTTLKNKLVYLDLENNTFTICKDVQDKQDMFGFVQYGEDGKPYDLVTDSDDFIFSNSEGDGIGFGNNYTQLLSYTEDMGENSLRLSNDVLTLHADYTEDNTIRVTGVSTPQEDIDATNKKYVDDTCMPKFGTVTTTDEDYYNNIDLDKAVIIKSNGDQFTLGSGAHLSSPTVVEITGPDSSKILMQGNGIVVSGSLKLGDTLAINEEYANTYLQKQLGEVSLDNDTGNQTVELNTYGGTTIFGASSEDTLVLTGNQVLVNEFDLMTLKSTIEDLQTRLAALEAK